MRRISSIIYSVGLLLILLSVKSTYAQSLPVGTPALEDYYRRMQLLGKIDSTVSFTVRPVFLAALPNINNLFDPESTLSKNGWTNTGSIRFAEGKGIFQVLPVTWQQQFNSHHPYGWNDGAMVPAKGYQTMLSGGFFFKIGPLSIQLRPEFVYAANPVFEGFSSGHSGDELRAYYAYYNSIDWPERYGNKVYRKANLGQSSVRLTVGPISIGLSNENLWWGPGVRNSLILSNNAPGFKHLTLNTLRPVKTKIGAFEGQIIAGRLDNSNYPPLLTTGLPDGTNLYLQKPDDWRYFTGFNINYQPKWVPGLTLGITRTFNAYHKDVKGFSGYIPFFTSYQKIESGINGDPYPRDQYTSLYSRWLFTKAQAEIYFEYGLNDNSYNYRDFIGSPDHSRAYVFGLRKMLALNQHSGQHLLVAAELTQLSQTPDRLVRNASGWYIHNELLQGHTHEGQILGAGTGSGGNLQSVDLSWVAGIKMIGLNFERYEHNIDFYRIAFADIDGNSRKWVDFAFALQGVWDYKNIILNAKVQGVRSLNYNWVLRNYISDDYYVPNNDVFNLHAELGITFRF